MHGLRFAALRGRLPARRACASAHSPWGQADCCTLNGERWSEAHIEMPNGWRFQDIAHAGIPSLTLPLARDALQWRLPHNIWSRDGVQLSHACAGSITDGLAYALVCTLTSCTDLLSGAVFRRDERHWLRRLILLETMCSVPGRVAERLLGSHAGLPRERGWMRALCGEAPKSRAHLSIAMSIHEPQPLFRSLVRLGEGVLLRSFSAWFVASPSFCRSFVAYLEEEAVKAYTSLLQDMDAGLLPRLAQLKAPAPACSFYGLPPETPLRDVFRCIRADELLAR